MSFFSTEVKKQIEHYLSRYETKRSGILPILHVIQDHYGWIQEEHVKALESEFGLHRVHVQEVATFYSAYRLEKPARWQVYVCDNLTCSMVGAKKSMNCIKKFVGDKKDANGEPLFSVEGVPCLGVCDKAPVLLVNKKRYHLATEDKVEEILSPYLEK
mgnify:CR=1 FL=1